MRKLLHDTSCILDVNIKSDSNQALKNAITLCIESDTNIYTHCKVDGHKIIFSKSAEKGYTELIFPIRMENAYFFVLNWIESVDKSNLKYEYPGGDGSHGLGFIVEKTWGISFSVEIMMIYYSK